MADFGALSRISDGGPVREPGRGYKGFNGGRKVKGVKRQLLVDTAGFLLSGFVRPANMHDKEGAKRVLGSIKFRMPNLSTIWADKGYAVDDLADYVSSNLISSPRALASHYLAVVSSEPVRINLLGAEGN